jgi:hypothetical protein
MNKLKMAQIAMQVVYYYEKLGSSRGEESDKSDRNCFIARALFRSSEQFWSPSVILARAFWLTRPTQLEKNRVIRVNTRLTTPSLDD